MQAKQIIINTMWFGIIPKITVLINILLLPFITPFLSPFDYGVIGIINSFTGIFILISTLGLNIHLTNSYYTHNIHFNKVWSRILSIILISSLFFSILYSIILAFSLVEVKGGIKIVTIIGACLPILFCANTTLANHYYPLIYNPKPLVLINLTSGILGIIITFILIYYLRLGFVGWIVGSAVTAIISFIIFIPRLWIKERISPAFSIKCRRLLNWLKISLPIVPHSLGFILLSSSDRIIMKILNVPIDDIGIYSNGYQIGDYITIITAAMIIAISPRIQELYRSQDFRKLKKLFIYCQITAILTIFLFSIWMPQIYHILIKNEALQQASSVAMLVCFANIFFPFYSFISTTAFIEEKSQKVLWLVLLPGLINIALNFIFIPLYGYKAAIITTLISYWLQLFIPNFVKYFRHKVITIFDGQYFTIILFLISTVLLFAALSISNVAIIYKVILSLFFISGFVFYTVKQQEF